MIGFSLKFWTMNPAQSGEGFDIGNSNTFIFQDEMYESVLQVADMVTKVAGQNPDLEKYVQAMLKSLTEAGGVEDTAVVEENVDPIDFVKHELKCTEALVKLEPEFTEMTEYEEEEEKWEEDFKDLRKKKDKGKSLASSGPIYKCENCLKGKSQVSSNRNNSQFFPKI